MHLSNFFTLQKKIKRVIKSQETGLGQRVFNTLPNDKGVLGIGGRIKY